MDITQLNSDFGLAEQLVFIEGPNSFPFIKINNNSATALISLYGGQVLSYKPKTEAEDLLFLSQESAYTEGKAIRGGIPVCWPWFGPDPKGLNRPNHGFVRNHFWLVTQTETISDNETTVRLVFKESIKKERTWQKPFTLRLEITVGKALRLNLTTYNTGEKAFAITQAFHSYFQVGHIKHVQILGLEGCEYFDKLAQGAQKFQTGKIRITEEVDRIYMDAKNELNIADTAFNRRIQITSSSTKSAVVWNPWIKTSKKMLDLDNTAYKNFVCVEMGNVAFDLIEIMPGEHYSLCANFNILPI
ncbi:MAG: D-hexose-6-phosphate mutarotase [Methylococcales bacterium]